MRLSAQYVAGAVQGQPQAEAVAHKITGGSADDFGDSANVFRQDRAVAAVVLGQDPATLPYVVGCGVCNRLAESAFLEIVGICSSTAIIHTDDAVFRVILIGMDSIAGHITGRVVSIIRHAGASSLSSIEVIKYDSAWRVRFGLPGACLKLE